MILDYLKNIAQGDEKFERMLTMGRESGDRRGLRFESKDLKSKSQSSNKSARKKETFNCTQIHLRQEETNVY